MLSPLRYIQGYVCMNRKVHRSELNMKHDLPLAAQWGCCSHALWLLWQGHQFTPGGAFVPSRLCTYPNSDLYHGCVCVYGGVGCLLAYEVVNWLHGSWCLHLENFDNLFLQVQLQRHLTTRQLIIRHTPTHWIYFHFNLIDTGPVNFISIFRDGCTSSMDRGANIVKVQHYDL